MKAHVSGREVDGCLPASCKWRGRDCVRLGNDVVGLTVLRSGGFLAEFGLVASDGGRLQNALWECPWEIGADKFRGDEELKRIYGDVGSGRFLERFTGHALCLDEFGPATEEEIAAGSGLHGEASLVEWSFSDVLPMSVRASAELPMAKLSVHRKLSLLAGESVVRVDERVTNRSEEPRPLHWVQHATVGAPMFGEGCAVATSAARGITWPLEYGGESGLALNAKFIWPEAPRASGAMADLRRLFAQERSGFVAAVRQPDAREYGFVAAINPTEGVALVYVFVSADFPWITMWEENRCRQEFPWNGTVQARGLEFGTTPLPLGKAVIDAAGPVLGFPTARTIAPAETLRAPWLMAVARTPRSGDSIEDVVVERDALVLVGQEDEVRLPAFGVAQFLSGASEEA